MLHHRLLLSYAQPPPTYVTLRSTGTATVRAVRKENVFDRRETEEGRRISRGILTILMAHAKITENAAAGAPMRTFWGLFFSEQATH